MLHHCLGTHTSLVFLQSFAVETAPMMEPSPCVPLLSVGLPVLTMKPLRAGFLFCVSHFHAESTCTRVIDLIQEENKPEMDFVSVYPESVIVTTAFYFFFFTKRGPTRFHNASEQQRLKMCSLGNCAKNSGMWLQSGRPNVC